MKATLKEYKWLQLQGQEQLLEQIDKRRQSLQYKNKKRRV